jgi:uncharacterized protein (DUF952 family)
MILHVTTITEWDRCLSEPAYYPLVYKNEGFIHCCSADQLSGVLERYFNDQKDLLLLHIDEKKVPGEIKWEAGPNNDMFPHIYGTIARNAIIRIEKIA